MAYEASKVDRFIIKLFILLKSAKSTLVKRNTFFLTICLINPTRDSLNIALITNIDSDLSDLIALQVKFTTSHEYLYLL